MVRWIELLWWYTNGTPLMKQINLLRLLIWCFILVRSAMFGATFNLVTRIGLP